MRCRLEYCWCAELGERLLSMSGAASISLDTYALQLGACPALGCGAAACVQMAHRVEVDQPRAAAPAAARGLLGQALAPLLTPQRHGHAETAARRVARELTGSATSEAAAETPLVGWTHWRPPSCLVSCEV